MTETIVVAPGGVGSLVAAVIEAILRLGCAVEIDNNFETRDASPVNGGVEVWSCTLSVWAPGLDVAPVTISIR